MWAGRILLEASFSKKSTTFLTLTYNDENLPETGALKRQDLKTFLKKLRYRADAYTHQKLRFFAVGEYGTKKQRPHYHAALFGLPPEEWEGQYKNAWSHGNIHCGYIEPDSALYIAGYTCKKLTKMGDERLGGKPPEFAHMSKYPPIGAPGIDHIENLLYTNAGSIALSIHKDIPSAYTVQGKTFPLGHYWRNKLRERIGITDPPKFVQYELTTEEKINDGKKAEKLFRQKKSDETRATL